MCVCVCAAVSICVLPRKLKRTWLECVEWLEASGRRFLCCFQYISLWPISIVCSCARAIRYVTNSCISYSTIGSVPLDAASLKRYIRAELACRPELNGGNDDCESWGSLHVMENGLIYLGLGGWIQMDGSAPIFMKQGRWTWRFSQLKCLSVVTKKKYYTPIQIVQQ